MQSTDDIMADYAATQSRQPPPPVDSLAFENARKVMGKALMVDPSGAQDFERAIVEMLHDRHAVDWKCAQWMAKDLIRLVFHPELPELPVSLPVSEEPRFAATGHG